MASGSPARLAYASSQGPASVGPGPRLLQLRLPSVPLLSFGMAPRQGAIPAPGPEPSGLQSTLEDPVEPKAEKTPGGFDPGSAEVLASPACSERVNRSIG